MSLLADRNLLTSVNKIAHIGGIDGSLYKRAITVTETSGTDLSDYQTRIDLDSSNFDFSKANSDGSDIRITDDSNAKLPFWIESWDATGQTAVVWVKIPSIAASSSVTIYMWYGNSSLSTESDGDSTFDFFDDFDTLDTTKWTLINTDSDTYVSGGMLHIGTYAAGVLSSSYAITDGIVESKWRMTSGARGNIKGRMTLTCSTTNEFGKNRFYDINFRFPNGDENLRKDTTSDCDNNTTLSSSSYSYTASKWYIAKLTLNGSNLSSRATEDATLLSTSDTDITSGGVGCGTDALVTAGTDYIEFDWIRVRKYTSSEPSISVGSEQPVVRGILPNVRTEVNVR